MPLFEVDESSSDTFFDMAPASKALLAPSGFTDDTGIAGTSWKVLKWYMLIPCSSMHVELISLKDDEEALLLKLIKAQLRQGDMKALIVSQD